MSKPSAQLSISPAATTLLDVIVGKFPGIRVIGDNISNANPKILIRGGSLSINNQASRRVCVISIYTNNNFIFIK